MPLSFLGWTGLMPVKAALLPGSEKQRLNLKSYTQPNCQLSRSANRCFWTCKNLENLTPTLCEKSFWVVFKNKQTNKKQKTQKPQSFQKNKSRTPRNTVAWNTRNSVSWEWPRSKGSLKNRGYIRHWCINDFSLSFKDLMTLDYIPSLQSQSLLVQWWII